MIRLRLRVMIRLRLRVMIRARARARARTRAKARAPEVTGLVLDFSQGCLEVFVTIVHHYRHK